MENNQFTLLLEKIDIMNNSINNLNDKFDDFKVYVDKRFD